MTGVVFKNNGLAFVEPKTQGVTLLHAVHLDVDTALALAELIGPVDYLPGAELRLGRRTVLTFPLDAPPQKN